MVIRMIFDSKSNYNVRNGFKQSWRDGSKRYLAEPRPRHGIVLVLSGNISFCSENSRLKASRGDIFLLPKGSFYETVIDSQEASDYLINFENDDLLLSEPTRLLSNAEGKYYDMFNKIIDYTFDGTKADYIIKSQFYMLLDYIVRDMEERRNSTGYFLEKAKEMLESDENYSVKAVAQKCGISESGLRDIFKKTYGASPVDYKMSIRINRAKMLLQATDNSVEAIAKTLNFYDTAYFCKVFKKNTGLSPKEYAKRKSL